MGNLFTSKEIDIDLPEEEVEELRMSSTFERKEIGRLHLEFRRMANGGDYLSKESFLKIPCIAANPLRDRICMCFGYAPDPDPDVEDEDENEDEDNEKVETYDENETLKEKEKKTLFELSIPMNSEAPTRTNSEVNGNGNQNTVVESSVNQSAGGGVEQEGMKLNFRSFLLGISYFNSYGRIEEKLKLAFRIQDFDNDGVISRAGKSERKRKGEICFLLSSPFVC